MGCVQCSLVFSEPTVSLVLSSADSSKTHIYSLVKLILSEALNFVIAQFITKIARYSPEFINFPPFYAYHQPSEMNFADLMPYL